MRSMASISRISSEQSPDGEPGDEVGAAGVCSNVALHSTKEKAALPGALGRGRFKNPAPQPVQWAVVSLETQQQQQLVGAA